MDVGILPGATKFGAAGGFFGGDAELFSSAFADILPVASERAEVIGSDRWRGRRRSRATGGFLLADLNRAVEDLQAAVMLREALSNDLNALDIELELFLAMRPAAEQRQLSVGDVGRRGDLEKVMLEGRENAGIQCILLGGVRASEMRGGFDMVRSQFGPAAVFETAQRSDMRLDAEAVRRGQRELLSDFLGRCFQQPLVELVELGLSENVKGRVHKQ